MSTLYDPELTQLLQKSGEYIGHIRPTGESSAWVLFLLDEEYKTLLEELQEGLGVRLDAA